MKFLTIVIGIIALLAVAGVGLYVTNFTAYMGSDPNTCNNCHVMDYVYENWLHGGHHTAATCNDCHTPHALIPKYIVKAQSGYHHVTAFVFGAIPDAIRAKEESKKVVQENCVRCHEHTVSTIMAGAQEFDRYCFDCHRSAAHGARGITTYPFQESNK
jgi:cytochrome c nitrite reductase small subunit